MNRVMKEIFSKMMFNILKYYMDFIMTYQVEKLVTNLHDKTEYLLYIRNLKQPSLRNMYVEIATNRVR